MKVTFGMFDNKSVFYTKLKKEVTRKLISRREEFARKRKFYVYCDPDYKWWEGQEEFLIVEYIRFATKTFPIF